MKALFVATLSQRACTDGLVLRRDLASGLGRPLGLVFSIAAGALFAAAFRLRPSRGASAQK